MLTVTVYICATISTINRQYISTCFTGFITATFLSTASYETTIAAVRCLYLANGNKHKYDIRKTYFGWWIFYSTLLLDIFLLLSLWYRWQAGLRLRSFGRTDLMFDNTISHNFFRLHLKRFVFLGMLFDGYNTTRMRISNTSQMRDNMSKRVLSTLSTLMRSSNRYLKCYFQCH